MKKKLMAAVMLLTAFVANSWACTNFIVGKESFSRRFGYGSLIQPTHMAFSAFYVTIPQPNIRQERCAISTSGIPANI